MGKLLAVLVRAMLDDLHAGEHRRVQLNLVSEVHVVGYGVEPHRASQVVRLCLTVTKTTEGLDLGLRN